MLPLVQKEKSLLLLDSFGGHKNKDTFTNQEEDSLKFDIIPAGCTSMIQPLDKYFFRQFKIVFRKIIDTARYKKCLKPKDYPPTHQREFQMRCLSITHQQFRAPIFKHMIRGAWSLCGYNMPDEDEMERFPSALEILFTFKYSRCFQSECKKSPFITCAYCRQYLCFDCFLFKSNEEHFHFEDSLQPTLLDYKKLDLIKKSNKKSKNQASNDDIEEQDEE